MASIETKQLSGPCLCIDDKDYYGESFEVKEGNSIFLFKKDPDDTKYKVYINSQYNFSVSFFSKILIQTKGQIIIKELSGHTIIHKWNPK